MPSESCPTLHYRLSTPAGAAVAVELHALPLPYPITLKVGSRCLGVDRAEAWALLVALLDALDFPAGAPDWLPDVIEPTDADGRPLPATHLPETTNLPAL